MTNKRERGMQRYAAVSAAACQSGSRQNAASSKEESASGSPP